MSALTDQLRRRKPIGVGHNEHGAHLERRIGTFQLTMFGVGATVGTGVFFVLSEAIPKAGAAVLISFVVAALCAGLSALCYAELSSAIPVSGSTYSYTYHALGEFAAIVVAACVLLEYGVSTSAVSVGWSGYFNELLQGVFGWQLPTALSVSFLPGPGEAASGGFINLPAVVLVLLCMLLLLRGTSESATVNTIMVLIKLGVLVLFAIIGFTAFEADHFSNFFGQAAGISAAAGVIFFSFIGLDAIATAGEEVKNPQKALPRAIIWALIIVTAVYLIVAVAGIGAEPVEFFSTEEAQTAGLAKILNNVTGATTWGTILAAGAVISIFSVTLICLYGQTRILFAIARDGFVPKNFLRVNRKTMVPAYNVVFVAIVVAIIAGFVPAGYLWDTVSIGTLMAFMFVAVSVIVLRRTHPEMERPFRVPLYPWVPILSIAACLYILAGLSWHTWLIFGVWVVIVVTYYWFYGRKHATLNRAVGDAVAQPNALGIETGSEQ